MHLLHSQNQVSHPTGYAIIQLFDRIFEAFENNLYTLWMFIDLVYSKVFNISRSHNIT